MPNNESEVGQSLKHIIDYRLAKIKAMFSRDISPIVIWFYRPNRN